MWKMLAKAYKFQEKTRKKNFAENFAQIAELWNSAAWHTRACTQKDATPKTGWTFWLAPWSAVLMLLQLFMGEQRGRS